jgi:hypothetical protein
MAKRSRYARGARAAEREAGLPAGEPREYWGKKVQRSANLSTVVWEGLEELAAQKKTSRNALMDEALQDFLKKQGESRDIKALKKVQSL